MSNQPDKNAQALRMSENRLRLVTNALPVCISYIDRELRYQFANQTYQKWFGRSPDEIVNQYLWDVIGQAAYERVKSKIERVFRGETVEYEAEMVYSPHHVRYVSATLVPDLAEDGQILGYYALIEDRSNQRKTEAELKDLAQRMLTVIETVGEGITLSNLGGEFMILNSKLEQITGYSREEVRSFEDFLIYLYPDLQERQRVAQEIQDVLRVGVRENIETQIITKSGKRKTLLVSTSRLEINNEPWLLSAYRDITERQVIELQLRDSEARLQTIVNNTFDGILILDGQGIVRFANPAVTRLFNKSIEQIMGSELGRPIVVGGSAEIELHSPGQEVKYAEMTVAEAQWEGENVYIVSLRDISERKQAERALRESEERFRRAFRDSAIGMALVTIEGEFLRVNRSLCEILGYSEAEFNHLTLQGITHPEDWSMSERYQQQVIRGEIRYFQQEKRYFNRQGQAVWVLVSASLVRDSEGEPLYLIAQVQDISEQRAIDQMKHEFISIVSHELRTPLTAIEGALGLLATGIYNNKPEKAQRMLEIARTDCDRLVRLVNDILSLERLDSGQFQLEMAPCSVTHLMEQSVEVMQAIANTVPITLTTRPIEAQVWAAADSILQTLTNLLNNAIKFSPPHTTVTVSAQDYGASICFCVQDQGRGIPPDKLHSIFRRFQQVDVSDARQKGGTGLGLAICQKIIEQHGGRIWAESQLGQGTCFYFTLPKA
ncbi:PAS domain S-box protein [Spirulina subsalsa FACHB-351]|uniref:histidine kinase n=1 Tax=Spirulina subsalsa FACHB-351 TaxID=234711 RepID=A0ABT3L0L9_9CYAN|nr:PAS domain S-box protein [Spirulina subsalsa]MCW6035026.1 PAS domain S-box protein [Spirulina subsalsa FACHB-351]